MIRDIIVVMNSKNHCQIIRASQVNIDELYEVIRKIYLTSQAFSEHFEDKYPNHQKLENEIQNRQTGSQQWVALYNDKPAGFLFLTPQTDTYLRHTSFFSMGVSPEFQSKGIGSQLVSQMLESRDPYIGIIYLMVRSNNENAIKLYTKHGFSPLAVLPKDTKVAGEYIDATLMSRSFI